MYGGKPAITADKVSSGSFAMPSPAAAFWNSAQIQTDFKLGWRDQWLRPTNMLVG